MTREEFIEHYAKNNPYKDELTKDMFALPCECSYPDCHGWSMVFDNKESINGHMDIFAPDDVRLSYYENPEKELNKYR